MRPFFVKNISIVILKRSPVFILDYIYKTNKYIIFPSLTPRFSKSLQVGLTFSQEKVNISGLMRRSKDSMAGFSSVTVN
jgi:hypothetical protein